jgi:hypothetical protein
MPDTREIAEALVGHCRAHTEAEGLATLYAKDAESIEANAMPDGSRVSRGIEAIEGKHEWWAQNFDVHSSEVDGPYIHDNRFAVMFTMDVTEKASGSRWKMSEIGLYTVEDGKIAREEFFQAPMPG